MVGFVSTGSFAALTFTGFFAADGILFLRMRKKARPAARRAAPTETPTATPIVPEPEVDHSLFGTNDDETVGVTLTEIEDVTESVGVSLELGFEVDDTLIESEMEAVAEEDAATLLEYDMLDVRDKEVDFVTEGGAREAEMEPVRVGDDDFGADADDVGDAEVAAFVK